ncbi:MAG: hypothetical protein ACW99U_04770 [Candidatus Thorarchaeota archaeon]
MTLDEDAGTLLEVLGPIVVVMIFSMMYVWVMNDYWLPPEGWARMILLLTSAFVLVSINGIVMFIGSEDRPSRAKRIEIRVAKALQERNERKHREQLKLEAEIKSRLRDNVREKAQNGVYPSLRPHTRDDLIVPIGSKPHSNDCRSCYYCTREMKGGGSWWVLCTNAARDESVESGSRHIRSRNGLVCWVEKK